MIDPRLANGCPVLTGSDEAKEYLWTALASAQAQFRPAKRSGRNPHFKSDYSTLDDLMDATRDALTNEGLSVAQPLYHRGGDLYLATILAHAGGATLTSEVPVPVDAGRGNVLQAAGASISYMRRYSYAAVLGIGGQEDDDGNSHATTKPSGSAKATPAGDDGPVSQETRQAILDARKRAQEVKAEVATMIPHDEGEAKLYLAQIREAIKEAE